jgi:hypothetical protein
VHAIIRAAAAPCSALDLRAADALVLRSSRHSGANMVFKSRSSFSDVLFLQVLIHLLHPIT